CARSGTYYVNYEDYFDYW
nr:immunoglobulin heavy chain junction region [Mus musculus]